MRKPISCNWSRWPQLRSHRGRRCIAPSRRSAGGLAGADFPAAAGRLMRVGLYSELARPPRRGSGFHRRGPLWSSADDIRRFRQDLMLAGSATAARIVEHRDFFSFSECRDLLFHRQEHRFTLPQISAFLAECGLEFLGFDLEGVLGAVPPALPRPRCAHRSRPVARLRDGKSPHLRRHVPILRAEGVIDAGSVAPSQERRGDTVWWPCAPSRRAGKGGHETSIDVLRRVRRAHAEQLSPLRGFAWARRPRAPLPTLHARASSRLITAYLGPVPERKPSPPS